MIALGMSPSLTCSYHLYTYFGFSVQVLPNIQIHDHARCLLQSSLLV